MLEGCIEFSSAVWVFKKHFHYLKRFDLSLHVFLNVMFISVYEVCWIFLTSNSRWDQGISLLILFLGSDVPSSTAMVKCSFKKINVTLFLWLGILCILVTLWYYHVSYLQPLLCFAIRPPRDISSFHSAAFSPTSAIFPTLHLYVQSYFPRPFLSTHIPGLKQKKRKKKNNPFVGRREPVINAEINL